MMEELKLVLTMLTQLGETGKEAFIWWLISNTVIKLTALFTTGWVAMRCLDFVKKL